MQGIKKLLQIPVVIKPFLSSDTAGDDTYGNDIITTCYAEGKLQPVTDVSGDQVLSSFTIYIDGAEAIKSKDLILYDDREFIIKALSPVKELNGDIAIWLVYI